VVNYRKLPTASSDFLDPGRIPVRHYLRLRTTIARKKDNNFSFFFGQAAHSSEIVGVVVAAVHGPYAAAGQLAG
jgi:hypothetical protein